MKFIHRFAYYLIGLVIGSIFVYFIWTKKDVQFDYLPNARVLKDIGNDSLIYSKQIENEMIVLGMDKTDIVFILKNGDIDFKNSKPREKPCKIYRINGEPKDIMVALQVEKCDSISTLESIVLIKD